MKIKTIVVIAACLALIAGLLIYSNSKPCRTTDKQRSILEGKIPRNVQDREVLMRSMESEARFIDEFCFNNPKQQLIRKFLEVPIIMTSQSFD